jgi:CBS domain-containing protein
MTKVRDVMTPNPAICEATATLQEVARKMQEVDTGFVPIVENRKVIGVVTDRDLAVRALTKGVDPTKTAVREFITPSHESVSPDASLEEAAEQMQHWHIRRVIVLEGDYPVGVVSLGDLAERHPEKGKEVLTEVSKSPKTLGDKQQG